MAKEYLTVDNKLVMIDGKLVEVPDNTEISNAVDSQESEIETTQANGDALVDSIKGYINGSPKGVYDNLSALQTTYPSGASGVYLTSDNGHWYYWNDTAWTDGGVYQSSDDVNALKEDLTEFKNAISEIYQSVNLFNKDSSLVKNGYYIKGHGDYQSLSGSYVSHPIKVESGKTYTFSITPSYYGQNAVIMRICDANGNLIEDAGYATNNGDGSASHTFIISGYCCVNVRTPATMMFVEGSSLPTEYQPYFDKCTKIKEEALPDLHFLSPLYGKKLALNGDSICYGAGSRGGYGAIIGENNKMTVSNIAESGGTIASGTTYSGGSERHHICDTIQNMPNDYDYYIIEGGINDAATDVGVKLGTITSDYTSAFDTTTLCGAMESICKELQTRFSGKKYGYIFVHNCYSMSGRWNTEFRPAMKQILEKWGIPYLDLGTECPQLRNIDALRVYTANSDGWHPTEDGYKLFYVPKIEAWLKTL